MASYQINQYLLFSVVFPLLLLSAVSVSSSSCPYNERSALLKFKVIFNHNCFASASAYAPETSLSWADRDCCMWDGVKCSNETGNVIGLDLSSRCLYGNLPSNTTLFNLPYLEYLDLSYNNFNYSSIPFGFGHHLSRLKVLNLSSSGFRGRIPSDFSRLRELSVLDLSYNSELQLKDLGLEGLVRNMTRLSKLDLGRVRISSPVPNLLSNFTFLTSISLDYCDLYGKFPTSLYQLPRLRELSVSGNPYLTGSLPKFEYDNPLRRLRLFETSFSGEIPPSIGNLAYLEQLSLWGCKFTGGIPSSIGNLTHLSILELDNNEFSGYMPASFRNLTNLQTLSISSLETPSDELLLWVSELNKLSELRLQAMNLTGEIPPILGNFTGLEYLDLSQNHLTGNIPLWLMNLSRLQELSLAGNQLVGSVPPTIYRLERLLRLYLSENSNLHANIHTLLSLRRLKYLDLSGLTLTFNSTISTNDSVAKLSYLALNGCNLKFFPKFLISQDELQVLALEDNAIDGAIPQWFVNVTGKTLLQLDLSYNLLTSFEQPTTHLPWVNVEVLTLDGNKIQGRLPVPSKSMLNYGVYNNSFSGDISLDICQASSLIYLDLSYNKLSGRIPECIVHFSDSLQVLDLGGNALSGPIPLGYPKTSRLKMINLSINRLSGNLPRSLANCNKLEVLDVGSNEIRDTFPSWLGHLPYLQILVLRRNYFRGEIGAENDSSTFISLRILDLSHNFLTGGLPDGYFKAWDAMKVADESHSGTYTTSFTYILRTSPYYSLQQVGYDYTTTIAIKGSDMLYMKMVTVLRFIDFSSNNFTGKIPTSIGGLVGLQAINMSNNNLEGEIPSSMSNIRDLESLDLSNNKLYGAIPQELAQVTSLEIFNVSYNLLFGPIPRGNQFDTFDNTSFEGNSGLCGGTLSKKCLNNVHEVPPPPPPVLATNTDESDDDSYLIDWLIRSLGCISGFVVGGIIGKYMTDKKHEWFEETFRRDKRSTGRRLRRRS